MVIERYIIHAHNDIADYCWFHPGFDPATGGMANQCVVSPYASNVVFAINRRVFVSSIRRLTVSCQS